MDRTNSMRIMIKAFAGIAFLISQYAFGTIDPAALQKGKYNQLSYTFTSGKSSGKAITFLLYVPASYTTTAKMPLLVHMHGGGAKTSWPDAGNSAGGYLLYFLQGNPNWTEAKYPCLILEPLCSPSWCGPCWDSLCAPSGPHVHNLNTPPNGIQVARDLIPVVQKDLGLDTTRCYMSGWSNGGSATWDMIMYWPTFFAAAVPVAGAGDTMHAVRELNVPVWAGASQDDDVVPFIGTKSMVDKLTSLGGKPKYTYVNGWHHFSEGAIWQTPELVPWLFSQTTTGVTKAIAAPGYGSGRDAQVFDVDQNGSRHSIKIRLREPAAIGNRPANLIIYNLQGHLVRSALNMSFGGHDGGVAEGEYFFSEPLSPGRYLCMINFGGKTETSSFVAIP